MQRKQDLGKGRWREVEERALSARTGLRESIACSARGCVAKHRANKRVLGQQRRATQCALCVRQRLLTCTSIHPHTCTPSSMHAKMVRTHLPPPIGPSPQLCCHIQPYTC